MCMEHITVHIHLCIISRQILGHNLKKKLKFACIICTNTFIFLPVKRCPYVGSLHFLYANKQVINCRIAVATTVVTGWPSMNTTIVSAPKSIVNYQRWWEDYTDDPTFPLSGLKCDGKCQLFDASIFHPILSQKWKWQHKTMPVTGERGAQSNLI